MDKNKLLEEAAFLAFKVTILEDRITRQKKVIQELKADNQALSAIIGRRYYYQVVSGPNISIA